MAVFANANDASGKPVVRAFVKGAGPAVIGRAATALANGQSVAWGDEQNKRSSEEMERLGGQGLRVMVAARRDLDPTEFDPNGDLLSLVKDLQMTAMVGMIDPPRAESKDAVRDAQAANIRVRMVTGDDVVTGAAIAKQLGIPGEAILGADFAALPEDERLARIDGIGVVGRVAPEHKVLMVDTLRKKGDVVAMTGDGVNDAPAIKAADIGIAMGSGTEVAKNAGKMILTDDNFATIVRAVSEGRKLYDNMLKYIRFMLVALVTYVVTFLLASLFNIAAGQPFSAVQILWINFLITAPIGIALGLDKETPGLMKRKPRPRNASIMSRPVILTVGLAGLFMSVAIDLVIVFGKDHWGQVEIGSTMGLVAFSLMLVIAALECRDQTASILRMETFDNNVVNVTILVELALALLIARGGALTSLLGTRAALRHAVADRGRSRRVAVRPVGARQADRASRDRGRGGGNTRGSARRYHARRHVTEGETDRSSCGARRCLARIAPQAPARSKSSPTSRARSNATTNPPVDTAAAAR